MLESTAVLGTAFTEAPGALVSTSSRTITAPAIGTQQFYRLRSCTTLSITDISVTNGLVVLHYQ